MAAGYNETKLLVLDLISMGSATAREVADYLDITHAGAASYLLKLHLQGLLGRGKESGSQERLYHLTDKGMDRLDWLRNLEGY